MKKSQLIVVLMSLLFVGVGCSENSSFDNEVATYEKESEIVEEEANLDLENISNEELEIERENIETQHWIGELTSYGDFWSRRRIFILQGVET